MKSVTRTLSSMLIALFLCAVTADGALCRVSPAQADVLPGTVANLTVEVETEAGDNVVGTGFFSFAIDLTLSGSAGAAANSIGNVGINDQDFDNLLFNSIGVEQGSQYIGVAGVTTDLVAPTFGEHVGDVTWLFDFDLTIPAAALAGDTITIMPGEGTLGNLIANVTFNNVAPMRFESARLTVVPEPSSLTLGILGLAIVAFTTRR